MPNLGHGLGGRLPLLEPAALSGKQRELYDHIAAQIMPLCDTAGFAGRDGEGHLIGPFNATLFSPEMGASFLALQKAEAQNTTLSERTRQVVILSVGSVWQAAYETYAHAAVASKAGLSAADIEALADGRKAEGLSQPEAVAQRFTRQLVMAHSVDDETYTDALAAFGERGLVEMLVLVGCYLSVCAMLNAFAIPVPET